MIRTICMLAFATAALAVPSKQVARVVNGTDAPQGKYPSQVSVQFYGSHICGGSILNENWVLTAARCVSGQEPDEWSVFAGDVDIEGKNGETRRAAQFIVHEDYQFLNYSINDIALIRVDTAFTFSDYIQVVALPSQNQNTEGGSNATVIGWGYEMTSGVMIRFLRETDILIYADPLCGVLHDDKPLPSNICAGTPEGNNGQCTGDTGGPLFVEGQQVGIVSWSFEPCTSPPYPGVYTEVAWYVEWINANIN